MFRLKVEAGEEAFGRPEGDFGAVRFAGLAFGLVFQNPAGEFRSHALAIAAGDDRERLGQGVDGFQADAVQADGAGERLGNAVAAGVKFAAGVDFRHAVDDTVQGDAAAIIPHLDQSVVLDSDLDALAGANREFINAVVNDFLEQDIDAVVLVIAVAETADIHTGAGLDVLKGIEAADRTFVVFR